MADTDTKELRKRRLAAGLSEILLDHAEKGQHFLGFLSYRRQDGLGLARWLRTRITNFKVPRELKEKIAARDASVGGSQNRVFLDMSYQKPNVDFWDEHIAASLCRSRTLILLQTPSVFKKLDNGESNWCEREIETFLKYYDNPSRILVVMGPDAPIDRFPAPLEKISARWDWVDLRFFSQSPLSRLRNGGQYDAQVVKVLAKIYDIADGDLPILGREFAKVRGRIRRNLAVAACLAIVSLSGLTAWALRERSRAFAAEEVAVTQRDNAVRERNAALISQSRYLASGADDLVKSGTIRGAIALLREALPDAAGGRDRPMVAEAVASTYKALYSNHETGKLELPPGTTAITSDARNDKIILATKDQFIVRNGFVRENTNAWPLDFGVTTHIELAPGDKLAALTTAGGAVMVRDITDNRVILRDAGAGEGTHVNFIKGGSLLVIADATYHHLRMLDLMTTKEIASRTLNPDNQKPIVPLFDAGSDLMVAVVDSKLVRLSPIDLSDAASLSVDAVDDYALALSQDKATIYLAAANAILDGRILEVDAASWTLKRAFSRIVWGAKQLAVSSRWNYLALIGSNGVDFFDLKMGERTGHVATSFTPTGGQFLGGTDDADYMVYGKDGSIRWISVDLGIETTAFMTIDGGAITRLDPLPKQSGFLSVSDLPSVTRWSYKLAATAADYNIPLVRSGIDFKMATQIQASDFQQESDTVTASYLGNGIYRWNVATGVSTEIKSPDYSKETTTAVAAVNKDVTLVAQASGTVQAYSVGVGSDKPAGEIALSPLSTLSTLSPSQAFAVTKSGEASLIDVSLPSSPTYLALPELGLCPLSAALKNFAICATNSGKLVVYRNSDRKIVYSRDDGATPFTYVSISKDGQRLAIADRDGRLEVRQLSDGIVVDDRVLQEDLGGARLGAALAAGRLSADDISEIRSGNQKLTKTFAATTLGFSSDGKQLAIAMPFGIVKVLDLETKRITELLAPRDSDITELVFSEHGALLAIHEIGKIETLEVFRVASKERLANISLIGQVKPKVYPLANGQGFLTIEDFGHIIVNPVFEKDEDLVSYLARGYPEKLTPAQRRAYFLE